jgi:phosphatidylglycerophosphate synthase
MTTDTAKLSRDAHTDFVATAFGPALQGRTFEARRASAYQRCLQVVAQRTTRFWLVQSISISRLLATLVFASLVFKNVPRELVLCLYAFAMVSDLIDGYLSRKLKVESQFGKVMDLVADRSLTAVSLLYAAAHGIDVLPLALIATRDLVMIAMRLISVEGTQLLPTNRIFGGIMAFLLWGNTLVLVVAGKSVGLITISNYIYWVAAVIFTFNLLLRGYASASRIKLALETPKP